MRTTFEEHDWLPTRHGALVQAAPVHQLNEVYDTRTRILVLQNPFTTVPGRRAERLLNDARFTEVDVNLYYWRARYRAVLERRPDPDRLSLRSRNYRDLEQRYYDYVERQLAEVEALIERFLAEEDASTPEPR